MSGLMICHRNFVSAGRDHNENRPELIVQGMLVLECPAHIGASRPLAKSKG